MTHSLTEDCSSSVSSVLGLSFEQLLFDSILISPLHAANRGFVGKTLAP